MDRYKEAAKLLAMAQKAGARHSQKDNDLIQQMHDRACELGAKCKCEEVMAHPTLRAQVEALILRHPGHANQKTHGNRFGGFDVAKESLRRLKGDKGEREKYKARARQKLGKEAKPKRMSAQQQMIDYAKSRMREGGPFTPEQWLGRMIKEGGIYTKSGKLARARREGKTITITETKRGEKHKIVNGRLVTTPFERTREVLRLDL